MGNLDISKGFGSQPTGMKSQWSIVKIYTYYNSW